MNLVIVLDLNFGDIYQVVLVGIFEGCGCFDFFYFLWDGVPGFDGAI